MINSSSWFDSDTAARMAEIQSNFRENQLVMDREWPRLLRENPGDWAAVWARRSFVATSDESLKAQLDCPGWVRAETVVRRIPKLKAQP
jgi:hypothetical protein